MTGEPFSLVWRENTYRDKLAAWSDIQDHMPALMLAATKHPIIAELGVRAGNSTAALLLGAHWAKGRVWSVDVNAPDVPQIWHQDPGWRFAQCDSVSAQAQAFLPPLLDLLFIDTSHTYAQTLAELTAYLPRMRDGGVIMCHDTQWDTGDVSLPEPGGPVTQALDDFCARFKLSWRNLRSRPGFYGMGVIDL